MQNKLFGAMYVLNIISQAIFSLVTPAALMFCISWLLINKAGAPEWIYAVTISLGIIVGLISMVKFVLAAASALERLENQNKNNSKTGRNNEKK